MEYVDQLAAQVDKHGMEMLVFVIKALIGMVVYAYFV
jgi:hypothetical protein